MTGGVEQARLPRRPPLQRRWVVILKIVALSLLLFPSSTGGKRQLKFEPETRPLPSTLAPEGKRGGGLDCRPRATRYCAVRWRVCLAQRVLCVGSVQCVGECAVCRGVCGV